MVAIISSRTDDMRRYNTPKAMEPAVIFKSTDGRVPANRDIAVYEGFHRPDACRNPQGFSLELAVPEV